jgi:hypothetical protein
MVTAALSVFGIALFAVLISALYFVDRLVRYEYQFHRDAWENDGRPTGYVFCPLEASWVRSRLAFGWLSMAWLFWTPQWIRSDPTARDLLSRLRWRVLIWNIGIVIFFVLLYFYLLAHEASNHSMNPTLPLQNKFSVFAPTPCVGLSHSR